MNWKTFENLFTELYDEEKKILESKGADYTPNSLDRLQNFKVVAEIVGITPEQVGFVYFLKHVLALASLVEKVEDETYRPSEPRMDRIKDIRNYALLIEALFRDREEGKVKDG